MNQQSPPTSSLPNSILCLTAGSFQEFSLQRMDSLVDDRVNILGFSIFNQSHAFFQEFAQSLNHSWQENCDHVPFPGPAVSTYHSPSWYPFASTYIPHWARHGGGTNPPGVQTSPGPAQKEVHTSVRKWLQGKRFGT